MSSACFVVHMGCLHCHIEYTSASKQSCATVKNNKVDRKEQRKEEKTVVVDEKTCRSHVCVRKNEWRMAGATTEKYAENKNPSGGT